MFMRISPMKSLFDVDHINDNLLWDLVNHSFPVSTFPAIDVAEYEGAYEVIAELPGVKKEDVRISLEKGNLILRGERKHYGFPEGTKVLLHETSTRPFERHFELPETVDGNGISANMENGILRIRLPKSEKARTREISIK